MGAEVVSQLLASTHGTIYVLVRAESVTAATYRLQSLWWGNESLFSAVGQRVIPVVGDITHEFNLESLSPDITHVIHCAAETGVQKSRDELWRVNVDGTRHMIQLASGLPQLQRFTYVSTAYVAGTRSGLITEDMLPAQRFYSLYEHSKAEAENIVRTSGLPVTICRPGMIVGNSRTGHTRNFNTIYYVLKLMLQGKLRWLPVGPDQTVNVIPVDDVARRVVSLSLKAEAQGGTFHLTVPSASLPRVGELVAEVRSWAAQNLHIHVPKPLYMPMPLLRGIGKRHNAGKEEKSHSLISNLTALMPYFMDNHTFDSTNAQRLTGSEYPDWRDYLPMQLSFACRNNFMRLNDNTIFEQACTRRNSRHYPVTYYNISASGMEKVTGQEMNALIGHFVGVLEQCGVRAGDTVAMSGINCTEYTAIDQAIGLVGAISVPIYYTTPAREVALLLEKCNTRWFFIGDERLSKNLDFIPPGIQLIPFGPLTHHEPVVDKAARTTPIDPTSLATIRYTSGTTGDPKGVMFNYCQLKWMGQVLTALLPWKDRNRQMRYLSFLPMNHVVEGILASYAPYCMLCASKIYYLNDFQMLTRALPQVRPTVFFSVPRFYEKLWEQVEQNPLGQRYLRMNDGQLRKWLGRLLRRAVLRKAGLDKCSQLLVGSAPMSEELLLRFRALGIEIHNAYGQTEAPLITLNRLGDNVIPSIGTPLPDTTISTGPDGELVVDGPQVAMGYYQLDSGTFKDGKLYTGDLGYIDADGHVYISGRKKDMLITSWGKNINCTKIEQLLTDIACVEHAVLVGEQLPYCTALLWVNGETSTLQTEIDRMNKSLSHPEQVKRWRIIKEPLSIQSGELTPNLKVKRNVVLEHYSSEVHEMYAD